jgi:hypothetical protein
MQPRIDGWTEELTGLNMPVVRAYFQFSSIARTFVSAAIAVIVLAVTGLAQERVIDPVAPSSCEINASRIIEGWLPAVGAVTEEYGRGIFAVGDLNGDGLADWVVEQFRSDTLYANPRSGVRNYGNELLLYFGIAEGIPPADIGLRLGPTERTTRASFLSAGDWDADGHRDVALFEHMLFDTSQGNIQEEVIGHVVVYWGNSSGALSNEDTTRLSSGVDWWIEPQRIDSRLGQDADGDGIDDLAVIAPYDGFADGARRSIPRLHVFNGGHTRWRDGPGANQAATTIWNLPDIGLDHWIGGQWIDHDGDGALDLALFYDTYASPASVAVVYRHRGGSLDSTTMESISLSGNGIGYSPEFIDVTGDRVPELVMATGELLTIRIYLGLRGQRLKKQFGSGLEPPNPGATEYWGRPWAEIMMPRALSPNWPYGGYGPILDLGDLGLDGVDDITSFARPYLTSYNGGNRLDSLVDGLVVVPETGMLPGTFRDVVCRLGDIDGSGVETIAAGFGGAKYEGSYRRGAVVFFKPNRCVPREGRYRPLPPGTDRPSRVEESPPAHARIDDLDFSVSPNPSDGQITACWTPEAGAAVITVCDALGRVVHRGSSPATLASTGVDLARLASGSYIVTLTIGQRSSSRPLVVR